MTDLMSTLGTDPEPPTTEQVQTEPHSGSLPAPGQSQLPQGVHPGDRSAPIRTDGRPQESNSPVGGDDRLGAQGQRTVPPWNTDNEEALPVYQRSAHDWSANEYTLGTTPIQIAGRLRGAQSTIIWVPTAAAHGCVISPSEGDITQGAGITLSPGDSIELATEAAVWAGVIVGQTTGTVYVVRLFNPPGGGLGLSAA